MKNRLCILAALLALLLALIGCQSPAKSQTETITLTDALGAEVSLSVLPERVVVIDPSMCEIFYAIGAQDSLVAVGSYCDYPEEADQKLKVGAYSNLNVEELIALTPDLILFGTMSTDEAKIEALISAGIEVAVLRADTIEDTYNNITNMGLLMGKTEQAGNVLSEMKETLDHYAQLGAQQSAKKKVFIEIMPLESGLYSCGSGTFQDQLISLIGAENIFASEGRWAAVSEEQVISLNPDVIISTTKDDAYDPIAEISSRAGWEGISAIRSGDIYFLDPNMISRASPRLMIAAQELYGVVYGE